MEIDLKIAKCKVLNLSFERYILKKAKKTIKINWKHLKECSMYIFIGIMFISEIKYLLDIS